MTPQGITEEEIQKHSEVERLPDEPPEEGVAVHNVSSHR